ncbi:MAG: thioredoxin family protein [Thermoflexales bacterium]|jgi:small redox-active disulfide protein 2|nr:thioredoxin family protein [Thermoflexales bacterium]
MLDIKVLGPGCDNCKKVEALAKQAVANLGVEAAIEKIIDRTEYPKYGLLYTPGLVINNKLVCGGRIPTEAEVLTWVADALN